MNDTQKAICLTKQAAAITEDVLKEMIKSFMQNKSEKKGEISLSALVKKSGKLESIEVTENNIGSFLSVAKKYDIDFALKRDKSTNPPTYHVFFATEKTENLKRAFTEYAAKAQTKSKSKTAEYTMNREQLHENVKNVALHNERQKQEKERTLQKNQKLSL